ncbi:uncharacterized protein LOC120536778 isoform X3 [Polypterus senegalus]|uniref:uncharacterized protein LOC120536778 isoform X3 n=1 Tax=Polypterus senegalus TaxID=55291 RepID=UPI00196604FE|nr:uncharacterized protein LOC120536778 isoform X3 [Polypterus senegalus]
MKQANNKAEHIITVLLSNSELTKEDLPTTFTIYHKDRYHLFQEGRPRILGSILSGILGVCSSFFRKTCIVKWFLAISVICSVFIFLLFAVSILLMVDIKETYSTYEIKMQLEIIAVLGVFNILEFINCIVSCCFASKGVCRDDFNSQPVVYLEYQSQSASRQNQEHIETSL